MKKIDLGQTISILANIGVIASIVFLGIEIRDGSIQARIATTQEIVAQRTEWRELIASDESLGDIYLRGLSDFHQLSPIEQTRFGALMESFMFNISVNISARNALLVGLNPNFEMRSVEGDLLRMLDQPGFRQWWTQTDRRGIPENVIRMTEELQTARTHLPSAR